MIKLRQSKDGKEKGYFLPCRAGNTHSLTHSFNTPLLRASFKNSYLSNYFIFGCTGWLAQEGLSYYTFSLMLKTCCTLSWFPPLEVLRKQRLKYPLTPSLSPHYPFHAQLSPESNSPLSKFTNHKPQNCYDVIKIGRLMLYLLPLRPLHLNLGLMASSTHITTGFRPLKRVTYSW